MRKRFLFTVSVMLACLVLTGTALADYGYTDVSLIPMAKDFSVRVEFDSEGLPVIVTDYPFESTGAAEMNLVYNKGDTPEAVSLRYRYHTGVTDVGSYDGSLFGHDTLSKAYEAIRNGDLTLDDTVYINTSNFYSGSDWFLSYSLSRGIYTEYKERTHAQAFNAMGSGGIEKAIYYSGGRIDYTRVMKRLDNADLTVYRNRYGQITSADIYVYDNESHIYSYNPATGLFGGRRLSELGFEEADLEMEGLAALGERTGTDTVSTSAVSTPAAGTDRPAFAMTGGLLAGIMIGITIYYLFRHRRKKRKEEAQAEVNSGTDGTSAAEEASGPEASETPEESFESTVQSAQNR